MLLSFDRTNFPLIAVEDVGVEAHLLPITKVQFEQFINESGGDKLPYLDMLALNPPVAPDKFTFEEIERLFITGILPDEALAFAGWLGDGFDLPTLTEWRAIYHTFRRAALPIDTPFSPDLLPGPAGLILTRLAAQAHRHSLLDVSLMRSGLVDWVRDNKQWVGLGAPRPEFHPNLWDPLTNTVKPIHAGERIPYFGFRLVRRGEWYLAEKERVRYVG